ncbi:helix-turn-helix domain-containing protein [Streptomyces sp. 3MP-14]|uniref:Helix-turn-helix domain-containing protein n=1 Tax=Streptomyces mimosae TaxID=2586635 RepID=A0A5N6ACJ9_9ACTN|nr:MULTISPECIES: helix-turn-helix transcriptional regulator [Streptomyces]KAB8165238.1 helix-turn-helix domain-containing protein [Streptomyces mimosae]KAB8175870.1 helix-turn-helix domain-containing protein [Streptomyces sp. 3MP-14]
MAAVSKVSPLTARRRLGAALRKLRDDHALTTEEVGAHLECHNSKVSRIELGKRACTPKDFKGLMELYEVDDTQAEELEALMKRARQRVPPWWHAYNDVISTNYSEFIAYEAEASRCREYQTVIIPGLLQTEAYAHAVTAGGYAALGPDQVEELVEVRMRRQRRLYEDDVLFLEVVMTEAALRLQVGGPEAMREQLRKLREVAELPHVELRVIPFEAGGKATSTGAFTLFTSEKDEDGDVAFTESAEATLRTHDDLMVTRRLNRLFRNLTAAALPPRDTLDLVQRIESELV